MDITFRLIEGPAPSGQIRAIDVQRIAGALHETSIRLGREFDEQHGPGRSRRPVEDLHQVRLVGLKGGSTTLELEIGPPDMLPIELEDAVWRDDMLRALLTGVAHDVRPEGVSDLVADSIGDLVQGLRSAATKIEMTFDEGAPSRFSTRAIAREAWAKSRRSVQDDEVEVSGVLEKIDIRSHALRVRDDVGNTFDLAEVSGDVEAGRFIGRRVTASGRAIRSREGVLLGLQDPTINEFVSVFPPAPKQDLLKGPWDDLPGPDPNGGVDMSDEEFADFMEAMGR